ncbi:MAG: hypothetical protein IT209_11825 [Armatimonadetes bacterium]|nr:hypothetical protein [Armatimonadota bacterium]
MADTVVITGVGPGLGASLAHKFASNGCQVAMLARSAEVTEVRPRTKAEPPGLLGVVAGNRLTPVAVFPVNPRLDGHGNAGVEVRLSSLQVS